MPEMVLSTDTVRKDVRLPATDCGLTCNHTTGKPLLKKMLLSLSEPWATQPWELLGSKLLLSCYVRLLGPCGSAPLAFDLYDLPHYEMSQAGGPGPYWLVLPCSAHYLSVFRLTSSSSNLMGHSWNDWKGNIEGNTCIEVLWGAHQM